MMRIRYPGWKKIGSGIRYGKKSDPGSAMGKSRIRDPLWKKVGSGIRKTSRIRNTGLQVQVPTGTVQFVG